jgi:hypothetical protein
MSGGRWPDDSARYRQALAPFPHIHLLEHESVEVGGVRFVGATQWTDLDAGAGAGAALLAISDFRMIQHQRRCLTSDDIMRAHYQAVRWFRVTLAQPVKGPTVVVTHNASSRLSHHKRFPLNERTSAFQARLDALILEYQSAAWIHGHTHWPVQ